MAKNKLEIVVDVKSEKGVGKLGDVNKELKQTEGSAESAGKGFGKMAIGIGVAVGALTALVKVSKEFIEVAQKQELAEKGLEIALKKQGDAAGEAFKSIKKLASARQDVTAVGDEITLQFSNILALGGQTGEQIESLIPTIQDLGAAYELAGKGTADYNKIATQVNKLIKEGVGDLSRFGIVLTDVEKKTIAAADETERQAIVMDKVSAAAGGMAEVLGNTSKGEMDQFNNVLGDVKENLGFLIIEGLKPVIKWVTKVVRSLRDATDRGTKTAGMLATLVDIFTVMSEAVILINDVLMDLWGLLGDIIGAGEGASGAMDLLRGAIRKVRLVILLLRAGAKGTISLLRELKTVAIDFWDAITSLDFDKLGDILSGGAERMSGAFKKGFKGVVDDFNETQAELAKGGGLVGTILTGSTGKAGKEVDPDIEMQKHIKALFERNKRTLEFLEAEENAATELRIAKQKERDAILEQQHEAFLDHEFKRLVEQAKAEEDLARDKEQAKQDALATTFQMMKGLFGDSFEGQKAFAAAEASMNTFNAATKALTAGPILGPILAGIITGLGLAQVGKILAEKKPSGFGDGGFTGNIPRNEIAGVVHGQEEVINANATAQHRAGLEMINAGISPQEAFNLQLPGAVPSQSGTNEMLLKGQFKIDGNDLVLVVAENIQNQRTGTF